MRIEEAEKEIASLLIDLEHNRFVAEIEGSQIAFDETVKCIECGREKPRQFFQKVFLRGEGICKNCWNCEDY
jgi:hypothetical protein